ncbi:response regulator transcription factor [Abyssisolibacter fermentans]|uniref:response regulator transcription factor n=1 Tax=Abyssisolibacter fermentans TaxID=1766203 RepID=UPI00082DB7FA|nr:response regulator [Abyssisolibacter fermentans]
MFKLLIVDDEAMTKEYIKYVLDKENIKVFIEEAENGKEALDKLKKFSADLILMDIRMPIMDGLSAAQEIKKLYPHMKVVMLSAYDEFKYAQKALRLGVDDYLLKPIPPKDLIDFINNDIQNYEKQLKCKNENNQNKLYPNEKLIIKAQDYIKDNHNKKLYLKEVADYVGFSPYYFSRLFKKFTGINFSDYVNKVRIKKAIEYMNNHDLSLREISEMVGYDDFSYFSSVFQKYEKILPSVFRKNIH